MVQHQSSAVIATKSRWTFAFSILVGIFFLAEISLAQALFQGQPPAPLKLRSNPLPACERGLQDPRFIESLDDHFNAVFAGRSLEERMNATSFEGTPTQEEKLQTVFSEIYSSDIRMKTNSLVKKFGKKAETDSSYAMPFHCLTPFPNGSGFTFELSSIPCSDPDNALSSIEEISSPQSQKALRDLLRTGGTSVGTQVLQSCSIKFNWDKQRKRYFAEKSFLKEISSSVDSETTGISAGIRYQVNGRTFPLAKMDCPLSTRLALGCHIRLHPRSEKHLFRLTESDWMPARESVICELSKDPAKAFDLEVELVKKMIRDNPALRDIGVGPNGAEKLTQSEEEALIRIVRARVQVSRAETLTALKQATVEFYTPRACNHMQEGANCNVVILSKQHRYANTLWDTFDYGIMSADQQTVRGYNGNVSVGPFTENRSYHDLPGMVGRAFLFGDTHEIYKVGGNPSRRQVEMFCSESK